MRWFVVSILAMAFLLIGWTSAQRNQSEDAAKLSELEKRLAEVERKVADLEKKVAELGNQVKQLKAQPRVIISPQHFLQWRVPFSQLVPEEQRGFGPPRPAPFPFVQPYYYPLETQP